MGSGKVAFSPSCPPSPQDPLHVFVSSFNEGIGGRQQSVYGAKIAINMGAYNDTVSQRETVWVDSYASEFSRSVGREASGDSKTIVHSRLPHHCASDLEPSVEGGNYSWRVVAACIARYKMGAPCSGKMPPPAGDLCCTREDKEVWANAWSLSSKGGADALVTTNASERAALLASGAWEENCHPIAAPTAFCVDTSGKVTDGRNGPFMTYNTSSALPPPSGTLSSAPVPLVRCRAPGGGHFLSDEAGCENIGTLDVALGWTADRPGGEALRALWRCKGPEAGVSWSHALDFPCDHPDRATPLGWVR